MRHSSRDRCAASRNRGFNCLATPSFPLLSSFNQLSAPTTARGRQLAQNSQVHLLEAMPSPPLESPTGPDAPPQGEAAGQSKDHDIEEGRDAYHPGGFHPVYIGDIYHDRYKVLNKIGYGVYSTVWLTQDLQAS